MIKRILDLSVLSQKKSLFLFGPRSTGKTTLLRQQFSETRIINLLNSSIFMQLSAKPADLREIVQAMPKTAEPIIIDEIQKLPILLDEIHDMIETMKVHFILTGSSARKLRQGGINLLAGRAWQTNLFPLTSSEIPNFNLDSYLLHGGLPQIYNKPDPIEELDAYINNYLKEEIMAESLAQNLVRFSSFLRTAALANTEQINFANISRDTGIPATSVRAWFEILQDSFIGFLLEPWQSPKRKAVATAKFYFFDTGVANYLSGFLQLNKNSAEYGKSFEQFVAMELRSYISYRRIKTDFYYWRTKEGLEVDFVIGKKAAIEVKASSSVHPGDLKGLKAIASEADFEKRILVCMEEMPRLTSDAIHILPWRHFLSELWADRIFE